MFTMDHSSYARWLPIFIHDLKSLQSNDPGVYKEFWQRKFTINKRRKPFSSIGIDQAHKQNNKLVKIDDGATDLLHDNAALLKWTVAGRKIAKWSEASVAMTMKTRKYHIITKTLMHSESSFAKM